MEEKTETLVSIVLAIVLMPITWLWTGFVGKTIWNWYGVEVGLPEISLAQSIGLQILVAFFVIPTTVYMIHAEVSDKSPVENVIGSTLFIIVMAGVSLFSAAVLQLFV